MSIYNHQGQRLYLSPSERERFIATATLEPPMQRTFCLMLAHTGCRLSEARYLRKEDLQRPEQLVSIFTLKRRETVVIREVPIPKSFVQLMEMAHFNALSPQSSYLWGKGQRPIPRTTAYRWVKEVMKKAEIEGPQASPKGLRHGFGMHASISGIQLQMIQKWMGHASIYTTAIYTTVQGPEELKIASRMWN